VPDAPQIVDPFAAGEAVTDPFAGPRRQPDTSVAQNVGVAARAAYPYATAAALGAAAGVPFGGLVGAATGAALGPLGLALSDIATTGYNIAAPAFGGERVSRPSENIQALYERYFGLGRRPETPGQELLSAAVEGATGAGAQARAFSRLAERFSPSRARNVMTELGRQPVVQAGAGAGGAAAPTALSEYGDVDDPYAGMAASLLGAMAGGRTVANAGNVARGTASTARMATMPTQEALRQEARRAYARAENAGVTYDPSEVQAFGTDLAQTLHKAGFDVGLHPKAAVALRRIQEAGAPGTSGAATPLRFEDLELLRRIAGNARLSLDPDERRIGGIITREIDNFVLQPPLNAITGGSGATAAIGQARSDATAAIRDARSAWSRMRKSEEIEELVERARFSALGSGGRMDEALRNEFANLARSIQRGNNPNFTPAEVANIERIARGEGGRMGTRFLSQLAPSLTPRGVASMAAQAGSLAAAAGSPAAVAVAPVTMLAGYGGRQVRDALSEFEANRLAAGMRRGDVTTPFDARSRNLFSPTIQQMLLKYDE
jgi:hypothetical protein